MEMRNICVFCGSSMGFNPFYKEKATELAQLFLDNKIGLVYGGANVGIMKVLADHILAGSGTVVGVMPRKLVDREIAHQNLSKLHIVDTMQERKLLMAGISEAFIAFPGGFGTLDELAEMITFNQLRMHDKPLGILNINGFFNKLLQFIDHTMEEGFVRKEHRDNLIVDSDSGKLLMKIKNYHPVEIEKWIKEIKNESST